jgi:hypothetical protein
MMNYQPENDDSLESKLLLPNKQGQFTEQGRANQYENRNDDDDNDDEAEYDQYGERIRKGSSSTEDIYNLHVDESFDQLSQGKGYLTVKEIKEWDIIKQLIADGILSEIDLNRSLESVQSATRNHLTVDDFAMFLDEIFTISGFQVEGYEGDRDMNTNSYEKNNPLLAEQKRRPSNQQEELQFMEEELMYENEEDMLEEMSDQVQVPDLFGSAMLDQHSDEDGNEDLDCFPGSNAFE